MQYIWRNLVLIYAISALGIDGLRMDSVIESAGYRHSMLVLLSNEQGDMLPRWLKRYPVIPR